MNSFGWAHSGGRRSRRRSGFRLSATFSLDDDELMARGTVGPTREKLSITLVPAVTVIVEYTVPTQCNNNDDDAGKGVGYPVTARVEYTMPKHGAGIMGGFEKRQLVSQV